MALGLPQWTPNIVLLKLAGQEILSDKIRRLANKFFITQISNSDFSPLYYNSPEAMNLNVLEEDKNYIISVLQDLNIGGDQIISIPRLITFLDLPCKMYTNRFKFQDKNLPIPAISVLFDETVKQEFQKFFIIATDASKNDQITSIAGISRKSSFAYRINHYDSIFSAETLAICQALDDLVESNVNLLVLSDSLSVLSALQNFSIKSNKELSPLMTRPTMETDNEESNDVSTPMTVSEQDVATPILSSVKKNSKRIVTGYILFASEVRRSVIAANPDRSFGDISRLIGTEWRNLPVSKKADYEERAQKQNEETQAQLLNESSLPHSPASTQGSERTEHVIYECMWDGCDHQFEDQTDLIDHLAAEPSGHIQQTYKTKGVEKSEIQCLWYNCQRIKKNIPPFPNVARLIRHVKEVHLKTSAKNVLPENRNRNFTPSKRNAATNMLTATSNSNFPTTFKNAPFNGGPPSSPFLPGISYPFGGVATPRPGQSSLPHPTKALEPMFVSTPPRTQRLLHSNVYIKYVCLTKQKVHI
ncbi:protein polybromo-1 [Trichonephila clavipes]|nr:protein polybromo-1 [Trichonephila clavipes]